MELVPGKYNYLRRGAVLNFENNVITIELDIDATNKESILQLWSDNVFHNVINKLWKTANTSNFTRKIGRYTWFLRQDWDIDS